MAARHTPRWKRDVQFSAILQFVEAGVGLLLAAWLMVVSTPAAALTNNRTSGYLLDQVPTPAAAQMIPPEAQPYRLDLSRQARMVWGPAAPVAVFAAQIHQESRWSSAARSPVGALGLAQFMPATARWIGTIDPALAAMAPHNPTWALRALVVYDRWLWDRIRADNNCERMAFALSAYNGGLGWAHKRQRLSPTPGVCMGQACQVNPGITAAAQRENEHYPRVILLQHQPRYRPWGTGLC